MTPEVGGCAPRAGVEAQTNQGTGMNILADVTEVFVALFMGVGAVFYLFFNAFLGTFLRSVL